MSKSLNELLAQEKIDFTEFEVALKDHVKKDQPVDPSQVAQTIARQEFGILEMSRLLDIFSDAIMVVSPKNKEGYNLLFTIQKAGLRNTTIKRLGLPADSTVSIRKGPHEAAVVL